MPVKLFTGYRVNIGCTGFNHRMFWRQKSRVHCCYSRNHYTYCFFKFTRHPRFDDALNLLSFARYTKYKRVRPIWRRPCPLFVFRTNVIHVFCYFFFFVFTPFSCLHYIHRLRFRDYFLILLHSPDVDGVE